MSDNQDDDFDDDYFDDDDFDLFEEDTGTISKSAMRMIEERREQMELAKTLRGDFTLDW